jgi:hypothetical protein
MNSTLERPPQGSSLNHQVNMVDTIDRRPLIQDHPHVPEIGVPLQQPWGSVEEQ